MKKYDLRAKPDLDPKCLQRLSADSNNRQRVLKVKK